MARIENCAVPDAVVVVVPPLLLVELVVVLVPALVPVELPCVVVVAPEPPVYAVGTVDACPVVVVVVFDLPFSYSYNRNAATPAAMRIPASLFSGTSITCGMTIPRLLLLRVDRHLRRRVRRCPIRANRHDIHRIIRIRLET